MVTVPLDRTLTLSDLALVRTLGRTADAASVRLWLVGGSVRDALLGRPVVDLDLTAEAPAEQLGPLLASAAGGRITSRSPFGTLKLRFGERIVDLATARSERYARPGALPTVADADLASDLRRRDISINAMAASLAPDSFAELCDTQGGLDDLAARRVRVLHEASFRDDATRILRVVRYATRLGFSIERRTARWLRRDLGYLDSISVGRVRRELERMLVEEHALPVLGAAWRRGVLAAVHPSWGAPEVQATLRRASARKAGLPPAAAFAALALVGVLAYALPTDVTAALETRLSLTRRQVAVASHTQRLRSIEGTLVGAPPSAVHAAAGEAPTEALIACLMATPDPAVRTAFARYLKRASAARAPLDGHALHAMGVGSGPELGRVADALYAAVLDGKVRSRSGARAYVQQFVAGVIRLSIDYRLRKGSP